MGHDCLGDEEPFHSDCLRPLENMIIYVTIQSSGKMTVIK